MSSNQAMSAKRSKADMFTKMDHDDPDSHKDTVPGIDPMNYNDPDSYKDAFEKTLAKSRCDSSRFVCPLSRPLTSDLTTLDFAKLMTGKYQTMWKGSVLMKSAFDLVIYTRILEELRPRTILDIGTANGGSALWFADQASALELEDCSVVTLDIEDMRAPKVKTHPRIDFWQGDLYSLAEALPPAKLATLPHPWFVVEDAHENVYKLLAHLHVHGLKPGDYVLIDDVHPEAPNECHMGHRNFFERYATGFGPKKYQEVHKFAVACSLEYRIDTAMCDMFGLNGTQAANAILKRVQPEEDVCVFEFLNTADIPWNDAKIRLQADGCVALRPKQGDDSALVHTAEVFRSLGLQEVTYSEGTEERPATETGFVQVTQTSDLVVVTPHNELLYTSEIPDVVLFVCASPPRPDGGETTIFDCRRALVLLQEDVRARFETDRVVFKRTLRDGSKDAALPATRTWQHVLQVESSTQASEAVLARGYQILAASEEQLTYAHAVSLVREGRLLMTDVFPWIYDNFYFGAWEKLYEAVWESSGEAIDGYFMSKVLAAMSRARRYFRWSRRGEMLVVANNKFAHGRAFFDGSERIILAAMGRYMV